MLVGESLRPLPNGATTGESDAPQNTEQHDRPVPVTGSDGQTTLEYVEGPTFWQEVAFNWEHNGIVGRLAIVCLLAVASPFLALGAVVSLVALVA